MKKVSCVYFIIFALCLSAEPKRSNIASNGVDYCDAIESTACLYIQDGLIAHWDGIENAGYGVHDSSATIWRNLVGTGDIELFLQNVEWHEDALYGKPRGWESASVNLAMGTAAAIPDFAYTVEVVLRTDNKGQMLYQKGAYNSPTKQHVFFTSAGSMQFARAVSGPSTGFYYTALPYAFHAARTCGDDNETIAVYLNGERYTAPVFRGVSFGGNVQRFGCGLQAREDIAFPYIGEVCAMRFYDRVLTDEEIAYNYELDAERFGL